MLTPKEKKEELLKALDAVMTMLELPGGMQMTAYQFMKLKIKPENVDTMLDDILPVIDKGYQDLKRIRES
jgi:hypothetical protein